MTGKIVVLNTCGSAEEAERIARALIEARLAACVNILGGVRSVYRWQGAVEDSAEWLLLIKTRRELFANVTETVRRVHSYAVPELIALPVTDGLADYLGWIDHETGGVEV